MAQGRVIGDRRKAFPCLMKHFPTYKLGFSHPVMRASTLAATSAMLHEVFHLVMLFNPIFVQDGRACEIISRFAALLLGLSYFGLLRIMILRAVASRLPNTPRPRLEKIATWSIWIFGVIGISAPVIASGKIFFEANSGEYVCIIQISSIATNVSFSVFDTFVSTCLLWLFYSRMIKIVDPSVQPEEQKRYLHVARTNMASSIVILGSTTVMSTSMVFSISAQEKYGAFAIGIEAIVSLALMVITSAVMFMFRLSFEWPEIPKTHSSASNRGMTQFLLKSFISQESSNTNTTQSSVTTFK
eukprot:TRINITY_DN20788_c0_g1_i1.p1 TRINITY_DN20788_c0_g1~~TRINITY_DN20788_c0_g1_i1.p1  ORF type:complete len:341 (+),score=69.81 TRINITY_DN20788_c0_g1_i1:126-1025(+)